ncbi:hypothetical protein ATO6_14685 [Oceanicola sp. 22II-s10i]|uniref:MFS transporter n=1 Tax=Oceanicola sp. 22II-s10i TaxID=1317116 RepID=UPI000B70EE0E|nr:MFS transporter [Oceanicola sp. 22II-s10i]OWU84271.1 hypothetical protein ATO6_14685 [Oceanicola sp. 22II-s10i]
MWKTRLAFGSPDLALSLLFATINGWLLFYLVTILDIPPLLAGAAFIFGRVLDGVLDPIIGDWADRRARKPVIGWALPFAAVGFISLWIVPALFVTPGSAAMATGLAFGIFALAYSCVSVPRLALLPAVVTGYDARTGQASVDMGFVFVGVLVASVAFPGAIASAGGGTLAASEPRVWMAAAFGLAALAVLAYLPFLVLIREPAQTSSAKPRPKPWVTLVDLARTNGAVPTLVLFAGTVLTLVTLQSILPFWLDRGPGLSAGGQSLVLLIVFGSTIGSLPLWSMLAGHLCKLRCLMVGIAVLLAGLAIAMTLPVGSGLTQGLLVAAAFAGAGAGALSMCPWAMIPDVAEAHARRLAAAVEGTASAAFTMTNKLAVALALFLNSVSLNVLGDQDNLSAVWPFLLLPGILAAVTLGLAGAMRVSRLPGLDRSSDTSI